jgi:PAS domain S-box-containing protein
MLFEAAGLAVWSMEPGEDRVQLSGEMARLLELDVRALALGEFMAAAAVAEDLDRLAEAVDSARGRGAPEPVVHYRRSHDGGLRALRTTFAAPAAGALVAATQDISEILEFSELRRRRIDQLALSTRRSPGAVAMFDLQSRYRSASPAWEKVAGLVGRDYLGRTTAETHPGLSGRILRLHERAAEGENFIDAEERVLDSEGCWRWLQCEYRPITAIDGELVGYLIHGHDITPLVEARREAQLNAERLRLALNAARAGVHNIDFRAQTFWCSPEFVQVIGSSMSFEEATGPAWPMTHPDDREHVRRQILGDAGKLTPSPLEFRIVLPTGETRWIQIQAENQHDDEGKIAQSVGFVVDIDARKRQELALMDARREAFENAERLSLALDAAKAGVFETDFVHKTFWFSPEFEEIVGQPLSFEQAAERVWFNVHPEDRAQVAEVVARGRRTLKVGPYETRLVLPSGEARWIHMSAVVHRGHDGETAKVVGLVLDIDARKRQELALEEARREAQNNAERLRIALDAGQAGVFETNFKNRTFWCSPQFADVIGRELTFEEASRRSWPMTHPDDAAEVTRRISESADQAGENQRKFGLIQSRIILPNGQIRWIDSCAELYRDDAGELEKVVGLVLNIDARKRQELELLQAQQAAEAATEAKSQFVANMSHEIRTPMNGVLGVLHLLEQEPLSPTAQELLGEAQACGRMLAQLLNDVIDFSKIEAGRLELTPEPLNAVDTLQGVLGMLRPQATAKGVELRAMFSGDGAWIMADPVRLRQALFNLIGNAVKFTSEGHVEVRLHMRGDGAGARRIRFEVEDTGVGIPEEAQASLFQRFHQADGSTARRFGGSGLGLAITRTLAEMMGGEVGFVSREGEGSTFWLDVPAPAASSRAAPDLEPTSALDGLKILVVEDNPTNRLVATRILESLGATVATAEDGLHGLDAVRAQAYDLVLMDVQMPRMDGVEATRCIRGLAGPAASTPIIGLTANALAHQRPTYLAAGMDGVAAKPISPPALLEEISRVLAGADEASAVSA